MTEMKEFLERNKTNLKPMIKVFDVSLMNNYHLLLEIENFEYSSECTRCYVSIEIKS